jgi:hypothetical protein
MFVHEKLSFMIMDKYCLNQFLMRGLGDIWWDGQTDGHNGYNMLPLILSYQLSSNIHYREGRLIIAHLKG